MAVGGEKFWLLRRRCTRSDRLEKPEKKEGPRLKRSDDDVPRRERSTTRKSLPTSNRGDDSPSRLQPRPKALDGCRETKRMSSSSSLEFRNSKTVTLNLQPPRGPTMTQSDTNSPYLAGDWTWRFGAELSLGKDCPGRVTRAGRSLGLRWNHQRRAQGSLGQKQSTGARELTSCSESEC